MSLPLFTEHEELDKTEQSTTIVPRKPVDSRNKFEKDAKEKLVIFRCSKKLHECVAM